MVGTRTLAARITPTRAVGMPATTRPTVVDGSTESDHDGTESGDRAGGGEMSVGTTPADPSSGGVTTLLGNGDGSFTAAGPNLDLTAGFALVATGDFDGDGIPD